MDLKYWLLTQNSHSDSFLVWQLAPVSHKASYNDNWPTLDNRKIQKIIKMLLFNIFAFKASFVRFNIAK